MGQFKAEDVKLIKLILPAGRRRDPEVVTLKPTTNRQDLSVQLLDHHLKDFGAYVQLLNYNINGNATSLNADAVEKLLGNRERRRDPTAEDKFAGPKDFNFVAGRARDRMKAETKPGTARGFGNRDDDEVHDSESDEPIAVTLLEEEVKAFITSHPERKVPRAEAANWVSGKFAGRTLEQRMDDIIQQAKFRGIIYHDPHHELTPGMILIDQIFLAMVNKVATLKGNPGSTLTNDIEDGLLQFVIDVATGTAGEPTSPTGGEAFGTYVLRAGDFHFAGGTETHHVDPMRIELFLDAKNKILATSVIVGAWAGGTHSAGHTSS